MNWRQLYKQIGPSQFSFLAYAAQLGFGFITFLVLVRKCSMEVFGWWVLMVSISSIADQARTGLIQNGMIRLLKQYPQKRKEVIGGASVLSLLASILLIPIVLFIWILYDLKEAINLEDFLLVGTCFGIGFMVQAYLRVRESILISDLRFDLLFLVKVSCGLSLFLGVLLIPDPELITLVGIQVLSLSIGLLVTLFFPRASLRWDQPIFLELFQYGRFVMGTNLGSMIYNKMDILILGSMMGPIAIGLYNAASRITNFVEVPLSSKAQVVFPQLAKSAAQNNLPQLVQQYELGLGKVLSILTPLCLLIIVFAKPILSLVAGPEYAAGSILLQVLCLSVLIKPWGRFFGITLDAINRPNLNFYFLLLWMVINLLLNVLLIPIFGSIGVAIATLICVGCSALIGQYILIQIIPISPKRVLQVGVNTIYKNINSKSL